MSLLVSLLARAATAAPDPYEFTDPKLDPYNPLRYIASNTLTAIAIGECRTGLFPPPLPLRPPLPPSPPRERMAGRARDHYACLLGLDRGRWARGGEGGAGKKKHRGGVQRR